MDLLPNKRDVFPKPITNTRISASEWNQIVGSCMAFITEAGFTPDANDNEQFLNAFKEIASNLELIGANTNLSNLTATGEAKFNAKVNLDGSNATFPHIVETYSNGTSWYRIWSDGWCEQGGEIMTTSAWFTTSLLKEFRDTNYYISGSATNANASSYTATGIGSGCHADFMGLTTTSFQVNTADDESFNHSVCRWRAEGYILQGV